MSPLGSKSGKPDKAAEKKAKADAAKAAKAAAKAAKKSGKPAKPAAAAAAAHGVVVEKPKFNVYSMMLILSFIAIVIACVCLSAEMAAYDWKFKANI